MATIQFTDLIKRYGSAAKPTPVIHGINASINDGEFVVIVGPSGCGKSTLLRMVAGLEEISGGSIRISGKVVNELEPAQRDIAMVFQNYALYPHMTVFDNMAYGLKIAKVPTEQIKMRVDKAAAMLELSALLERKPGQLSGGQRQRVAMGRAIVRQPQVFLFDEPLSNLDAKLRASTRLQIQQLHRELGITSLFVTHDQVEAMTLAQRMMVMNAGKVEQFGTPEQVYHTPASTFVASFIGAPPMNLLKDSPYVPKGQILGIRPEHLQVLDTPQDGAWQATVLGIEMLGAERLLYCQLANDELSESLVVRVNETTPAPAIGSILALQPQAGKLHYFDATTGLRV